MISVNLTGVSFKKDEPRDPKYRMTKELPSWGTMNDLTDDQAYSVFISMTEKEFDVNVFKTSSKQDSKICLFWSKKISDERVSNASQICIFEEHFTIKEEYIGWETGLKYGI
jgi:hypothetical protein